jgi:hypothetical protein
MCQIFISIICIFLLCCADLHNDTKISTLPVDKSSTLDTRLAYDCVTSTIDVNQKKWTYRVAFLSLDQAQKEIFLNVSSSQLVDGKALVQNFEQLTLSRRGEYHFSLDHRVTLKFVRLENRYSIYVNHESTGLEARPENGWCKTLQLSKNKENQTHSNPINLDDRTVHLRFAGFIPCDVVGIPFSWIRRWSHYKGDHRSFDFNAAKNQSRASISALISKTRIEAQSKWIGESQAFTADQVIKDGSLCYRLLNNEEAGEVKTDANYDHQVWHSTKQTGEYTITKTRLKLHATDPIPYGPVPSLDAYVDILIWWDDQKPIYYQASGITDSFPSYELYINGNRIYEFDAIEANIGPFGLVGHEQPFSTEQKVIPSFPNGVTP